MAAVMLSIVANAATVTINAGDVKAASFTSNGVTFKGDRGTNNQSDPTYNKTKGDLRYYAGNTLTITCKNKITSVVFSLSDDGVTRACDIDASVGEATTDVVAKTVTWSGEATEIVLTVGAKAVYGTDNTKAGQLDFLSAELTVEGEIEDDPQPQPQPEVVVATIAEFLAAADLEQVYELTGVVANIKNTTYGNFDLVDETGSVYIYGLLNANGEAKQFASMDIEEGDTLTLQGVYTTFKDAPQIANAQYISHKKGVKPEPEVIVATIAEFLAAADANVYELTGVVANIQNTTYGNFDLVDETGSVYIYGLLNANGEAKQFASMDIEEGDTLTLQGVYYLFNETVEIKNAQYISHKKGLHDGLQLVEAADIVNVVDGNLVVKAEGSLQVYTVAGQVLYSNRVNGQTTICGLNKGQMLIVRVDNKVAKVIF